MTNKEKLDKLNKDIEDKFRVINQRYDEIQLKAEKDREPIKLALAIEDLINRYNELCKDKPIHSVFIDIDKKGISKVVVHDYVKILSEYKVDEGEPF